MKQELGPLQKKWVEALRSGKYRQCPDKLHGGPLRYCCLGVAQHVVLGIKTPVGIEGTLQLSAVDGMKFRSDIGSIRGALLSGYSTLAEANDAGVSFGNIAKFVEDHPQQLFTEPA